MKKIDLATVTTNEVKAMKGTYPQAQTQYRLARWETRTQRWVIYPSTWPTFEAADHYGSVDTVSGFTHYTVLTIHLPGVDLKAVGK